MLLVACVAMVFVSCSDDDDNGTPFGGKQISKITKLDANGEVSSYYNNFNYSKEGRVIGYHWEDNETKLDVTYSYEKDKITRKEIEKEFNYTDHIEAIYHLNNKGIVISETGDYKTATYHYDNSNQLLFIESKDGDDDYSFEWSNGNITKQVYTYETKNFTYNSNALKNFGINHLIEDTPDNILWMYGYFGAKNKNLMASTQEDSNSPYFNEYEFDGDGNVTTMKEYRTENGTKTLEKTVTVEYK